ncbi:MAG TPA: sulfite exporter TauE/SafE family protein [Chitinophagaceae bacterium]|nr:sulfite exporter TauE/SafE family protein [Chitinophagaceae bacterium]
MITTVWILLIALAVWFAFVLIRDFIRHKKNLEKSSWLKTAMIGFVVDFFDVLGIGSFAPQIALLKFTKQTEDQIMPGTLNVSNTIPALVEAIIFIKVIKVDPVTLVLMLASATIGGIYGAGIVSKFSEKKVRFTIGIALLIAGFFLLANKLGWIQGSGDSTGLTGWKLVVAVLVNFVLGAFNTAGIGLYAPCMALVFALGMSPITAFPIMMGSCAFLMPLASARFIAKGAYNRKASFSMAIAGTVAVLIAAFIVKSLPLEILKWLVLGVIIITAIVMLRVALRPAEKIQPGIAVKSV